MSFAIFLFFCFSTVQLYAENTPTENHRETLKILSYYLSPFKKDGKISWPFVNKKILYKLGDTLLGDKDENSLIIEVNTEDQTKLCEITANAISEEITKEWSSENINMKRNEELKNILYGNIYDFVANLLKEQKSIILCSSDRLPDFEVLKEVSKKEIEPGKKTIYEDWKKVVKKFNE